MNWLDHINIDMNISIYLIDNIKVEGIVFQKENDCLILKNNLNKKIIIPDLSLIVLIVENINGEFIKDLETKNEQLDDDIKASARSLITEPNNVLKTQSLKQLYAAKIESDKFIVQHKLKDHIPGGNNKTFYGTPNFFKKPESE